MTRIARCPAALPPTQDGRCDQPPDQRDHALPTFSVIVPSYARPDQLRSCLDALTRLDYPRERFEVIVVDDGSPTPLEAIVAPLRDRLDLTLLRQTNRGPAAARNAGSARARGEFLAFTDDDCVPEPAWLASFGRRLATAPDHLLGGRTTNALPQNLFSAASQDLLDYLYERLPHARDLDPFFTSNNLALSAARFRELGGFDESLPLAGEDRDLCERWQKRRWPMAYVEGAVVRHAHALALRSFWRQHFNYGRGNAHLQRARTLREMRGLRPKTLSYYVEMLRYPYRSCGPGPATLRAGLMALSRLAAAAGFLWDEAERRMDRRKGRRRTFGGVTTDQSGATGGRQDRSCRSGSAWRPDRS